MQNTLLRYVRIAPTKFPTRVFSTTPRLQHFSRPIRSTKFVETLRKETREPVWQLIEVLHNRKHQLDLSAALHNYAVSSQEFSRWKATLYKPDIDNAVATLHAQGFVTSRTEQPGPPHSSLGLHPPSWLVLYLTGYKVRTQKQATGSLLDLVYAHMDVAPMNIQGPLLIFTILNLARFNALIPMRGVIKTFLTIPLSDPPLLFNLMLQAIACNPVRSVKNADLVVSVLGAMKSRQLKLRSSSYDALLNDRFVTLQLTKYLRERMTREGFIPTASHLEAYLRVFAKYGAIHDAQEYYRAIRASRGSDETKEFSGASQHPLHRANTIMLSAHADQTSAFGFLNGLAEPDMEYIGDGDHLDKRTRSPPPHQRPVRSPSLLHREGIDIFDFTSALSVAARDSSINETRLIAMFRRTLIPTSTIRPTIATYTTLLRGLLYRKAFIPAEKYWDALIKTGLAIDRPALAVGLKILTKAGKIHDAFMLLEKHAARAEPSVPGVYRVHRPIPITSTFINKFLYELNGIGRPDLVFKLWDHMEVLYGVSPDNRTLTILLQAARLASRLDDSFSGVMAQLALKNPFRVPPFKPTSRDSIVASIKDTTGDKEVGFKPYVSGIWNDQPPLEAARLVFLRAVIGHHPKLLHVTSPAHAIRTSVDDDPMTSFGLPKFGPIKGRFIPPPNLLTHQGKTLYPHIIVTKENFNMYIIILGLMSRASEIPLALAWMRALDIKPDKATLAVSLIFWSEISVQAPLIETLTGGPEKSEYMRLVNWLKDWVGPSRMPEDWLLERWRHVVAKMRDPDARWFSDS